MKPRGVVYATGAVSAIGTTSLETAMLLRTGLPAITEAPLSAGDPKSGITMGMTRLLSPTRFGSERATELLGLALAELVTSVRDAGGLAIRDLKLRVAVSIDEEVAGSTTLLRNQLTALLANQLGQVDVRFSPPNGPGGAAGAAHVLDDALTALTLREADAVLLCGVHTDYDPERITRLVAEDRLFSPENPNAVIPGEAAAALLIGRPDLVHRIRMDPRLELFSIGTAKGDLTPFSSTSVFEDFALTNAFEAAMADLAEELKIGFALTDLGTEQYRVREFYATLTRISQRFMEPMSIDAPAQRIGALGAASMPLSLVLASEMSVRGYAPAPLGVVVGGSGQGARAAMVVGTPS